MYDLETNKQHHHNSLSASSTFTSGLHLTSPLSLSQRSCCISCPFSSHPAPTSAATAPTSRPTSTPYPAPRRVLRAPRNMTADQPIDDEPMSEADSAASTTPPRCDAPPPTEAGCGWGRRDCTQCEAEGIRRITPGSHDQARCHTHTPTPPHPPSPRLRPGSGRSERGTSRE